MCGKKERETINKRESCECVCVCARVCVIIGYCVNEINWKCQ